MGRPKKEISKSEFLHVRLTKDEKNMLQDIVDFEGYNSVSEYIRTCIKRDGIEDNGWADIR